MKYQKVFSVRENKWKWGVDGTIAGVRIRRYDWDTKKEAEEAMAALKLRAREMRYGLTPMHRTTRTLGDLAEKVRARGLSNIKVAALSIAIDTWGEGRELATLTRPDMAAIKDAFDARELEASSVVTYRGALYTLLNSAGEFFEELAEWQPPKFPKCERAQPRQRTVQPSEVAAALAVLRTPGLLPGEQPRLAWLRGEMLDLARLMLLTGARREQIEAITASSITWAQGLVNLHSGKVKRWHVIPLNQTALAILRRRPVGADGRLFRKMRECQVKSTCNRLPGYGRADGQGWTLHDWRRTAATVIESGGIAYSAVAALLGHKRKDITAVYTVAQLAEMRRAVALLENWCREIDGFVDDFKDTEGIAQTALRA